MPARINPGYRFKAQNIEGRLHTTSGEADEVVTDGGVRNQLAGEDVAGPDIIASRRQHRNAGGQVHDRKSRPF